MEAVSTLVRLGQRLKDIRGSSKQREGKELLAWIEAGGINSLEAGLVAFLTAAAIQPAGPVFYSEGENKAPGRDKEERHRIAVEVLERWNNVDHIAKHILNLTEGTQPTVLAYYLAGTGFDDNTMLSADPLVELKAWSKDIDESASNVINFLRGYGDSELTNLAYDVIGIYLLYSGKNSPISIKDLEALIKDNILGEGDLASFEWYLGGAGYTYTTLANLTSQEIRDLVDQYKAVDFPTELEAFMAGYENGSTLV